MQPKTTTHAAGPTVRRTFRSTAAYGTDRGAGP